MTSPMIHPFVYPIGRDFSYRQKLVNIRRGKKGYVPGEVLDEVPIQFLLRKGLNREITIHTTHAHESDFEEISKDSFFLWNPLFSLKIPCIIKPSSMREEHQHPIALHRKSAIPIEQIPEKIWHSFREGRRNPNVPYCPKPWYQDQVIILNLDFSLEVGRAPFRKMNAIFDGERVQTLPLHLLHQWTYINTVRKQIDGGQSHPPKHGGVWIEEQKPTPVTNVWKDFIVIRRNETRTQLQLGFAGDFHHSFQNKNIINQYDYAHDIDNQIRKFRDKTYTLWNRGKLDYLILNGDMIDFYMNPEGLPSGYPYAPGINHPYPYSSANWTGFDKLVKLGIEDKSRMKLLHVPIIWNIGDHDRLSKQRPLPIKYDTCFSWTAVPPHIDEEILEEHPTYHYNFNGLNWADTRRFNNDHQFYGPMELGWSPETGAPRNLWPFLYPWQSCPEHLRWIFENSRYPTWPQNIVFKIGQKTINVILLDTGQVDISSVDPQKQFCSDVFPCEGIHSSLNLLKTRRNDIFSIIITHSPPICLKPDDRFHNDEKANLIAYQANYGSFKKGRKDLLMTLNQRIKKNQPFLIVSGHVHYKSGYFLNHTTQSPEPNVETGKSIWKAIEGLNRGRIPATDFWTRHPGLQLTLPSIGPKPRNGTSEILHITIQQSGVKGMKWFEI